MRGLNKEERIFSFLINPSNMKRDFKKLVNTYFTRGGWVIEHVSDELPSLTMSGTTAAFKNDSLKDKTTERNDLLEYDRRFTIGYRNLQHLIDLYRNNGATFFKDLFQGPTESYDGTVFNYRQRISTGFPVRITYGSEEVYEGFFTGMSTSETAENPYRLDFSLDFKITSFREMWRLSG